uniref:MADF domain-containing protein n=1 Tax=Heterorhabditis bacteriophora TaxID=37862 RepID=A0A1I7WMT2_HETBA
MHGRREDYTLSTTQIWRELRAVCEENDVDYNKHKDNFSILSEFKHREKLSTKVVNSLQSIARSGLLEECQKKKRILQLPYNYK